MRGASFCGRLPHCVNCWPCFVATAAAADIVHALRPQPRRTDGDDTAAAATVAGTEGQPEAAAPTLQGGGATGAPYVGSAEEEMSTTELLSLLISK